MGVIIAQIQKKDSKYSQTVRQAKRRRVLVLQLSIKRKKGGGREASPPPFYSFDDGSVPSTGQRRPGLPRAGPAVLSARWGLASGFGTGPGVPPCSGRYHLIEDEDVTRARVRELAIKYYPTVEESTRRLPRDLPASSSSRSRSSISPASRSRRNRATKPQTITGTQARALLPAKTRESQP